MPPPPPPLASARPAASAPLDADVRRSRAVQPLPLVLVLSLLSLHLSASLAATVSASATLGTHGSKETRAVDVNVNVNDVVDVLAAAADVNVNDVNDVNPAVDFVRSDVGGDNDADDVSDEDHVQRGEREDTGEGSSVETVGWAYGSDDGRENDEIDRHADDVRTNVGGDFGGRQHVGVERDTRFGKSLERVEPPVITTTTHTPKTYRTPHPSKASSDDVTNSVREGVREDDVTESRTISRNDVTAMTKAREKYKGEKRSELRPVAKRSTEAKPNGDRTSIDNEALPVIESHRADVDVENDMQQRPSFDQRLSHRPILRSVLLEKLRVAEELIRGPTTIREDLPQRPELSQPKKDEDNSRFAHFRLSTRDLPVASVFREGEDDVTLAKTRATVARDQNDVSVRSYVRTFDNQSPVLAFDTVESAYGVDDTKHSAQKSALKRYRKDPQALSDPTNVDATSDVDTDATGDVRSIENKPREENLPLHDGKQDEGARSTSASVLDNDDAAYDVDTHVIDDVRNTEKNPREENLLLHDGKQDDDVMATPGNSSDTADSNQQQSTVTTTPDHVTPGAADVTHADVETGSDATFKVKDVEHRSRKKHVAKRAAQRHLAAGKSCTRPRGKGRLFQLSRHPRDVSPAGGGPGGHGGHALTLSGREVMRLKREALGAGRGVPTRNVSLEVWVRASGGQADPVTLVGLSDSCNGPLTGSFWTLGIRTQHGEGERDARFFFALKSDRAPKATVILAHARYVPDKWSHLAATYDGDKMALYINGAKIAVGHDQKGEVFSPAVQSCKEILLGGDLSSSLHFRGSLDDLRIYDVAVTHADVNRHMNDVTEGTGNPGEKGLLFRDRFNDVIAWESVLGVTPIIQPSSLPVQTPEVTLTTPPCGQTVCDDPDVVLSYAAHRELRGKKLVRYRVINLMTDEGRGPKVTSRQIQRQHDALNDAFRPYNISFELTVFNVTNTTLHERLIMIGCDPKMVGDGFCHRECSHTRTGNDGGDCDPVPSYCHRRRRGNGVCDFECNRAYYNWDDGDCCLAGPETHYTCFDPLSPLRGYISIQEFKATLRVPSDLHLNVYFATWIPDKLIGVATFPWEKDVFTIQGGTVVQAEKFGEVGHMDSLVHEVGHTLGLWHVHHGLSEMECSDPCVETRRSMELGDLCADTAPTPQNPFCRDPHSAQDTCGLMASYTDTPFRNYMSYAGDDCTDNFTPHQVARMHCYLDLVYQPWTESSAPSPVPLSPRVVSANAQSVSIAWLPPLGPGNSADPVCGICQPEGALIQYVTSASSPGNPIAGGHWSPLEATGTPDSEVCEASTTAWMPDLGCSKRRCQLDLELQWSVVARSLSLWVTWNAKNGVRKLRLFFEDGTTTTIREVPAFCDMPFTTPIHSLQRLTKVRVYTRTPYTAIDALEVISAPGDPHCQACQPMIYEVHRKPSFPGTRPEVVSEPHYTDLTAQQGVMYHYWVKALGGRGEVSAPSPPLTYTHAQSYCGDGNVDRQTEEECDDGNVVDGDGCSIDCKIEGFFHCQGSPSLCYRHHGDGVCEDFERRSSVRDCGFYTPPGFRDQWGYRALANPAYQLPHCPESVITGPPDPSQTCGPYVDPGKAWFPCIGFLQDGNFWAEVYFPQPVIATEVIVHIAADGRLDIDPRPKNLTVDLITENDTLVPLKPRGITLDCARPIVSIPIQHDLSQEFYRTQGVRISFRFHNISISAVRLRYSPYLDPLTLASCAPNQLYSSRSGRCRDDTCVAPTCGAFTTPHGHVTCTGYTEHDVCSVTCSSGYRLTGKGGTGQVVCRGGGWVGEASCQPLQCGPPSVPFASVTCPQGHDLGQICSFQCLAPATTQGSETSIRCEEDGLWSAPQATCQVRCPPPLNVPHAKLKRKSCKQGKQPVGSRCKFRCRRGYHVEGARRKRRVFRKTCKQDGQWAGPRCVKVACPPISSVFNGLVTCTEEFLTGSSCTVTCPGEFSEPQTIVCEETGHWSGSLQMCQSFTSSHCEEPPNVRGLVFKCQDLRAGGKCRVSCDAYLTDHEAVWSPRRRFPSTPLSPLPGSQEVVTSVTCSGTGSWWPDPRGLQCVPKCSTAFQGDGWCDPTNNRAHCRWDGGDCCPSTLGHKVMPFPESCTTDCRCRDPSASENRKKRKRGRKRKRKQKKSRD